MSDFPELQSSLVDAARRRYGRAPRTWRIVRPVAIAAVCAAAVAGVIIVAGTPPDDRSANPPAGRELTPLEQGFAVFRRPATASDELPHVKAVMKRFGTADGNTLNPDVTRKVVDDGRWQVFLSSARISGAPAACATVFHNGKLAIWSGCTLKVPPDEVDPKTPFGNGWFVGDYSWPPSTTEPGAYMIMVADGVEGLTYTYADGSKERLPVENNMVFVSPIERWPERLSWVDDGEPVSQIVQSAKDYRY